MKLFSDNCFFPFNKAGHIVFLAALLFQSCATHHAQFGKNTKNPVSQNATDSSKIVHTFYLIGDAGNADEKKAQQTLGLLEQRLAQSNKNSSLLFLGDNIYPKGLPNTDQPNERRNVAGRAIGRAGLIRRVHRARPSGKWLRRRKSRPSAIGADLPGIVEDIEHAVRHHW